VRDPGPGDVVAREATGGPRESHGCAGSKPHFLYLERLSLFEESLSCQRCGAEWRRKLGSVDSDSKELVFETSSNYEIKRIPRSHRLPSEQDPVHKLAEAIAKFVPVSFVERERVRQELRKEIQKQELKARLNQLRGKQ